MPACEMTLGTKLRAERESRGLTVPAMAKALRDNTPEDERRHLPTLVDLQRMIRNWESDKWGVSELYRLAYCRAFEKTEDEVFGAYLAKKAAKAVAAKTARAKAKAERAGTMAPAREEDADDMERRKLLQALATLGVATVSPVTDALHTIQQHVEKSLDNDLSTQMDEWDATVTEYGYSYLAMSPERLVGDLAADLVAVQALKPHLPAQAQRARWYRVTAGMSLLMAKTLSNLGYTRPSRSWWATAQHAADAAGDADLGMWIAGERLIRGLYERRPAPVLIRRAAAAADTYGPRATVGLLRVHTTRAQVFAMSGRSEDAVAAVRCAEDVFAGLPSSMTEDLASDWCFGEDRIHYSTAWVHAYLGQPGPLDQAAARAVELLEEADHPRGVTQVRLIQAAGYVRAGDIAAGIGHATAVFEECPPEQRTALVTELADGVWTAIPTSQRKDPAIEGYRELLALSGARKAIT